MLQERLAVCMHDHPSRMMQVGQEVRAVEKSTADLQSPKVLVSFSRKSEALTQVRIYSAAHGT